MHGALPDRQLSCSPGSVQAPLEGQAPALPSRTQPFQGSGLPVSVDGGGPDWRHRAQRCVTSPQRGMLSPLPRPRHHRSRLQCTKVARAASLQVQSSSAQPRGLETAAEVLRRELPCVAPAPAPCRCLSAGSPSPKESFSCTSMFPGGTGQDSSCARVAKGSEGWPAVGVRAGVLLPQCNAFSPPLRCQTGLKPGSGLPLVLLHERWRCLRGCWTGRASSHPNKFWPPVPDDIHVEGRSTGGSWSLLFLSLRITSRTAAAVQVCSIPLVLPA